MKIERGVQVGSGWRQADKLLLEEKIQIKCHIEEKRNTVRYPSNVFPIGSSSHTHVFTEMGKGKAETLSSSVIDLF